MEDQLKKELLLDVSSTRDSPKASVVRVIRQRYARIATEEVVRYKHASRNEHQSTVVECECAYIGRVSVY